MVVIPRSTHFILHPTPFYFRSLGRAPPPLPPVVAVEPYNIPTWITQALQPGVLADFVMCDGLVWIKMTIVMGNLKNGHPILCDVQETGYSSRTDANAISDHWTRSAHSRLACEQTQKAQKAQTSMRNIKGRRRKGDGAPMQERYIDTC